ncbi:MAG: ATP-dependent sacrificial sulfur transferase LarE [Actinomycetota bacterium]|nr:ATP-dependent sacrificial sulfur transferase LarE [Actinomycetota bacterium]
MATVTEPHPDGPIALERLRAEVSAHDRLVVAFSGGVDSALLARVAHDELGAERVHVVTAVSPSLPADERDHAASLADEWGLRWSAVETAEMESAAYRSNDAERCAHCKDALMDVLAPLAEAEDATVVLGVNADDLGDHRPGQAAAAARGARFPLVDAGLNKVDVRAASRHLGLRTADKPAAACLASRIPYGTQVTVALLSTVERAEASLRRLGFDDLRVRHHGDTARIEVPLNRLFDVVELRGDVVDAVLGAGYRYATLDLEGLRSGNLNDALGDPPRS